MPRKASPRKKSRQSPKSRRWWGWALLAVGVVTLAVAAVAVPYVVVLDREVRQSFGELVWQVPTRVFARPLELRPGMPMSADALELELEAAAYRAAQDVTLPGTYRRSGEAFAIHTRSFIDSDGEWPERRLEVGLGQGRLRSLAGRDGSPLQQALVDPARIATLHGQRQEERRLVRLDEVPVLLITGLQAVEDRDFKHHRGIDPMGILRAAWVNMREGGLSQGGSTLTQQLVRSLFLSREKVFSRKINEALYAMIIEARFDKGTILEAYLNQVYLGQSGSQAVHGVSAASEFWFGREVRGLREHEIALLIGMIRGPSYYDPRRYPERALARRNLVLDMMAETGLLDADTQAAAKARGLGITTRPGVAGNRHPAFLDLVRRQLERDYPANALRGAGLSVYTTLAPSAQMYAEASVRENLDALQNERRPALQGAMVVTDVRSGEVVAVVGDRVPGRVGFNRAIEAQRPVGSVLKPFVYLLAMAQPGRYSLATVVDDAPIQVSLPGGRSWAPENSDGRSHGRVRLIDALALSYNQATVRLGMEVGVDRLAQLLKVLGEVDAPANPSLILGSVDLSPLAVTQLYQFLASGGEIQPLRAVRGVVDADGKPVNRYREDIDPAQGGDSITARLVTIALQRAVTDGTGRGLMSDGLGWMRVAGKTGTSNDGRDSWFAGYTGSHLAVAWVGNDANEATGLYGATGAMRLWSTLVRSLPGEPLQVGDTDLQWAWVSAEEYATTDETCPQAQRYPFVRGYLPGYHRGCTVERVRGWFGRDNRE